MPEKILSLTDAAAIARGEMPAARDASGGRRLAITKNSDMQDIKAAAKKARDKREGVLRVIKDRTEACLSAGKDSISIGECRDDPNVIKIRRKLRPVRKERMDNREQRAKAAMEAVANCKRAKQTTDVCEAKGKAKSAKVFPSVQAQGKKETKESWESMKGRWKKERMRRYLLDCTKSKKSICENSAKDDLKLELDVDEREIGMLKLQALPMLIADEIASCEDVIHPNPPEGKIKQLDEKCQKLGKEEFLAAGSTESDWGRWKDRISKLAKSRFEGGDTNIQVSEEEVDTLIQYDSKDGVCDEKVVNRIREDIVKAAKKSDLGGKGDTVVKSQGPDKAAKQCVVIYRTKVGKGKPKEAAKAINDAKDIGKALEKSDRRLRYLAENEANVAVSSSPTSEEVPSGDEPEQTDFSQNGGNDKDDQDDEAINENLMSGASGLWPTHSIVTVAACVLAFLSTSAVI